MKSRRMRESKIVSLVVVALMLGVTAAEARARKSTIPFDQAKIIIEFNATDQDVGVQVFLDAEAWRNVRILGPDQKGIFEVSSRGRLKKLGVSELFFESDEPSLADLPLAEFLALFPEGEYKFLGETPEGDKLQSTATFTHKIPDGPVVVSPALQDPNNTVIRWNPVTSPPGVGIVGYEVIIEHDPLRVFDVKLPATTTSVTVPREFLEPSTEYGFEVLAIEAGGNQTITESSFSTR